MFWESRVHDITAYIRKKSIMILEKNLALIDVTMNVFRDTMDVVKQSAALCLLRLLRTAPDVVPGGEWTGRIIHLLNDQHLGVVTAAASLIDALVKRNPDEYKGCVSLAVSRLSRVSNFFLLRVHSGITALKVTIFF